MNPGKIKLHANTIAFALLCLANILDLFVPRRDDSNYFVRMPIQLINGFLLIFMWATLLFKTFHWNAVTKTTALFLILIGSYTLFYLYGHKFNFAEYSPYFKFLLWTTSIIFFYEMMLRHGLNKRWIAFYIVTFLASATKKIIELSVFENETLNAGDTAALPLLFLLPIILICINDKLKVFIIGIVVVLVLISLRRTAILGLVLSLPFIYKYVRSSLRTSHIVVFGMVLATVVYYSWGFIGDAVIYRFQNLIIGDAGGNKESFGSGRSEFYMTVWNGWVNSGTQSLLFGNGLNSSHDVLMNVHNIQHAHNDFLEIGYTFGLIGIGIWFFFLGYLWKLKHKIKEYCPRVMPLFFICFLSYLIIGLSSGCILRSTTISLSLVIAMLLYETEKGKYTAEILNNENLVAQPDLLQEEQ